MLLCSEKKKKNLYGLINGFGEKSSFYINPKTLILSLETISHVGFHTVSIYHCLCFSWIWFSQVPSVCQILLMKFSDRKVPLYISWKEYQFLYSLNQIFWMLSAKEVNMLSWESFLSNVSRISGWVQTDCQHKNWPLLFSLIVVLLSA